MISKPYHYQGDLYDDICADIYDDIRDDICVVSFEQYSQLLEYLVDLPRSVLKASPDDNINAERKDWGASHLNESGS